MLPRRSMKPRSGRAQASWARRRAAPVAIKAPGSSSDSRLPTSASRDRLVRGSPPARARRRRVPMGGPWPNGRRCRPGAAHRFVDLGDEDAVAADLPDRHFCQTVASRLDRDELDLEPLFADSSSSATRRVWTSASGLRAGGEPEKVIAASGHGGAPSTLQRPKSVRRASARRSPRGVPAARFNSTVGPWRTLASIRLLADSTAARSSPTGRPSRRRRGRTRRGASPPRGHATLRSAAPSPVHASRSRSARSLHR